MTAPRRHQRSRAKGWRMPPGAVYVGRPTWWGNPFRLDGPLDFLTVVAITGRGGPEARRLAETLLHRAWVTSAGSIVPADGVELSAIDRALLPSLRAPPPPLIKAVRRYLAGRDLVCWCPLDGPCHADTLLEIANGGPPSPPTRDL